MAEERGPWGWIQDWDVERFGEEILDEVERARWAGRFLIGGGLPYIWRELARPISDVIYGLLELREGDRVLVIGEALEPAGWPAAMRAIVGERGRVETIEIIREAREKRMSRFRGRHGMVATWQWTYTQHLADESFDCVAVLQATEHCDDWRETGTDLLRIMKPGRRLVFAEAHIGGPVFEAKVNADVHLRQWYEKFQRPTNQPLPEMPYYSGEQMGAAFEGLLEDPQSMEWKGIEMFWGRKPR